ncbi:M4 family metallopeptidase [Nocardia sp. 348MFTsu5.1]|uniref:M4 family metallopeptidase n=1 Tax=Nocardia sp. 348MFTsu5.1 TaxID=1172185 RepID=UPI000362FFD7|nr:M4 family metallopeptidase [Nocardia sp. 348MFTsu5.1]
MYDNGLTSFALHSEDATEGPTLEALNDEVVKIGEAAPVNSEDLDPETAARRYLDQMIVSPEVPTITADGAGPGTEYRTIGTETMPLTETTVVKFAQYRQHIPIYGSLVTIELDETNSMLAMNSALGNPDGVDAVATVSPAGAQEVIADDAGQDALPLAEPPRLYFYYDNSDSGATWRLAYIAKDVEQHRSPKQDNQGDTLPQLFDYVVDANSGALIAKLPRTQSVSWTLDEQESTDGLGHNRQIRAERDQNGNKRLVDPIRRVKTYDFKFGRIETQLGSLPGSEPITNPPEPWDPAAVSAHANAQEVADYLINTLRRDGLDNRGAPFVSSINCTSVREPDSDQWHNAAWFRNQMVYGQRRVNGELCSYAVAKDVVAHEITHGLTSNTARLEYQGESGALNESYSDIFGIIIANSHEPNVDNWDWEMGEELNETGIPLRDLSDPTLRGQPAHMDDFVVTAADNGGVHKNSGIHNKAAFNLITARDGGAHVFTPAESGALFYLALINNLSRTSGFSDSRRAVELAGKSLFRREEQEPRDTKISAIGGAFDAVGIIR